MYQPFQVYIDSQKRLAKRFLLIAFGFVLLSLAIYLLGSGKFYQGMFAGSLFCAAFMALGNFAYSRFCENMLIKGKQSYAENQQSFIATERLRVAKVAQEFMVYQLSYFLIMLVSVLLAALVLTSYWQGFAWAIAVMMLLIMIVEQIMRPSISEYLKQLS